MFICIHVCLFQIVKRYEVAFFVGRSARNDTYYYYDDYVKVWFSVQDMQQLIFEEDWKKWSRMEREVWKKRKEKKKWRATHAKP